MKKFLLIDDNQAFVDLIKKAFLKDGNVMASMCLTVNEALEEISKHSPDIIFLDHNLEQGGEGLKIADKVMSTNKEVKIYSTTSDFSSDLLSEYEKRGIEHVVKDFVTIRSIVYGD